MVRHSEPPPLALLRSDAAPVKVEKRPEAPAADRSEVLTAPGGLLYDLDPGMAAKCALVRRNDRLEFHVLTALLNSPEVDAFRRAASVRLNEPVPEPLAATVSAIRAFNIAQTDKKILGGKATETRARLTELIAAAAAVFTNDLKLDRGEDRAIVRFQKNNTLSPPVERFEMSGIDADLLITSAFNYGDAGDPVEQPGADQKFTITDPRKLPANVQAIRGQTAAREDGRRLVLRIIYKSTSFSAMSLADVGLLKPHLENLYYVQNCNAGLFTVTAPTDNGKSTTLNLFCIDMVRGRQGRVDVIGIDDPVEFMAPEICQLAMPERMDGQDPFEQKIHTTLRLAPHAIKIGECRTGATANAAIDAAVTGRLVMTTQHTTGALGVPFRYERMGVERDVAFDHEVHVCWMSQRLVSSLCPKCRIPLDALPADFDPRRRVVMERFHQILKPFPGRYSVRGPGCPDCRKDPTVPAGLGKRIMNAEVILPDRALCQMLAERQPVEARRHVIVDLKTPTMALHGFLHMRLGNIGIEEYMNAIGGHVQLAEDLKALAASPLARDFGVAPAETRP